jgi:uncharacterized protein
LVEEGIMSPIDGEKIDKDAIFAQSAYNPILSPMLRVPAMTLRVIFLLLLFSTKSWAAGFDCSKASTRTEHLICSDTKLIELDQQLTVAYRKAYGAALDRKLLKAEQIEWLKERDACETSECVRSKYQNRIEGLCEIKPDFSWLKDYAGKSTNRLVWDKRFDKFLKSISPRTQHDFGLGEQNLEGQLMDALGGPSDSIGLADDRYLTFSACMPRFCPEKGWVWVDLKNSIAIAAIVHYDSRKEKFEDDPVLLVFSNQVDVAASLPRLKTDLGNWLAQKDARKSLSKKYFIDAGGKVTNFTLP